jgi:arabinogalactan oligomer/maltooligosaccharide transport system substrate-binding protein
VSNALGASQLNGEQWGVPYTYGNVGVLLYNRKLLPVPPATTDEMVAMAQKLTNLKAANPIDREAGLAIDLNQPEWFVAWLGGFGGALLDANNQPTLNTPEMVKTLQFYHDLAYKDKVASPTYEFGTNQVEYAFRDGRLGMMIAGDWSISVFAGVTAQPGQITPSPAASSLVVTPGSTDYSDRFELGVAPLPKISATGKYPAPLINNKAIFIGALAKGDQLNAAKTFVEFLAKPEQQQAMVAQGLLPTTQSGLNSDLVKNNLVLSGLAAQLAVAKPLPSVYEMRAIWDAILPNLQAVSSDTMTPAVAVKAMQEMAVQKIKLLKSGS